VLDKQSGDSLRHTQLLALEIRQPTIGPTI
jgi:hypothetical protein